MYSYEPKYNYSGGARLYKSIIVYQYLSIFIGQCIDLSLFYEMFDQQDSVLITFGFMVCFQLLIIAAFYSVIKILLPFCFEKRAYSWFSKSYLTEEAEKELVEKIKENNKHKSNLRKGNKIGNEKNNKDKKKKEKAHFECETEEHKIMKQMRELNERYMF